VGSVIISTEEKLAKLLRCKKPPLGEVGRGLFFGEVWRGLFKIPDISASTIRDEIENRNG
jgi:hypothetical protein